MKTTYGRENNDLFNEQNYYNGVALYDAWILESLGHKADHCTILLCADHWTQHLAEQCCFSKAQASVNSFEMTFLEKSARFCCAVVAEYIVL
jgi:hypothetical protein